MNNIGFENLSGSTACAWTLDEVLLQFKQEHRLLTERLKELYGMAKRIGDNQEVVNWQQELLIIKECTSQFVEELEDHFTWEQEVIYPMIMSYNEEGIMYPISVLDYEYEMAKYNWNQFLSELEHMKVPVLRAETEYIVQNLIEFFNIIQHHFVNEEKGLYPMAEHILREVDMFFS